MKEYKKFLLQMIALSLFTTCLAFLLFCFLAFDAVSNEDNDKMNFVKIIF